MSCEHKYVNMEDGTGDKFCVRCSKKFKQAVAYMDSRANPGDILINQTVNTNVLLHATEAEVIEGLKRGLIRSMDKGFREGVF